jgi:hypothetical protein
LLKKTIVHIAFIKWCRLLDEKIITGHMLVDAGLATTLAWMMGLLV